MPANLQHYYTRFMPLFEAVEADDLASTKPHSGHGFWDHDVVVAMMATLIALNPRTGDMAFIAGLIHSTDRKVENDKIDETLDRYLQLVTSDFSPSELALIKEAVMRHDEFKEENVETRSLVQKTLMDADKIINLETLVIVRSGQFQPFIPAVEPQWIGRKDDGARYNNPASTYREPTSVLEVLRGCVEWAEPGWIHFEKSQRRVDTLAKKLQDFIDDAERIYIELGIAGFKP
jgi:hypothetical protein